MITEVSQYNRFDTTHWVELYNTGDKPLKLSDYQLRSMALKVKPTAVKPKIYLEEKPLDFPLPEGVEVQPKSFVLLAARPQNMQKLLAGSSTSQRVYVGAKAQNSNDYYVPLWHYNGSGFVEIRKKQSNATVDYVRIGDGSSQGYQPQKQWAGNGTAKAIADSRQGFGRSLARIFNDLKTNPTPRDTNTAADWQVIDFATPGGINDVPPGAKDADKDGIPDSAEVPGSTYAGLDLYAMGARQNQRDIFVEIDYMLKVDAANNTKPPEEQDTGTAPLKKSLDMVKLAFHNRKIALHFDAGKRFSTTGFEPEKHNLGGGNGIAFEDCTHLPAEDEDRKADCGNFYTHKNTHFDVRRSYIFHYLLMANSQRTAAERTPKQSGAKPNNGPSGIAEVDGSNMLLTMGNNQLSMEGTRRRAFSINLMAGTIMHELGHNLGLRHGGDVDTGDKPNYPSIMNYLYGYGMPSDLKGKEATDRYMHTHHGQPKYSCDLSNSPCGNQFKLDYSDGTGKPLDENNLNEADLIGRGAYAGAYADWNGNGRFDAASYAQNLNGDKKPNGEDRIEVLKDYNDWGNLRLPFAYSYAGTQQGRRVPIQSSQPAGTVVDRSVRVRNKSASRPELVVEPPLPRMNWKQP